jgi:hypothetical protein
MVSCFANWVDSHILEGKVMRKFKSGDQVIEIENLQNEMKELSTKQKEIAGRIGKLKDIIGK